MVRQVIKVEAMSTSDIQKLKELTGYGIIECKNAFSECNGDLSQALRVLLKDSHEKMLELAKDERTPDWVLESLALSTSEEVVYLVSKNPSTPISTKKEAKQDTLNYSNAHKVTDINIQIVELRKEITLIKKAYNSLLQTLENRDKEFYELLGQMNKNINTRTYRSANYTALDFIDFLT